MDVVMDYKELDKKLLDFGYKRSDFAELMGMSEQSLSKRYHGVTQWKTTEIIKACEILDIPLEESYRYFFTQKV